MLFSSIFVLSSSSSSSSLLSINCSKKDGGEITGSDDGSLVGGTLSLAVMEAMENSGNSIGKFSKKRKLEDEQLTLPLSKIKCITQSSDRSREAALSFDQGGTESDTNTCNRNSLSGSKDCGSKSMVTDVVSPTDSGGGYTELVSRSGESSSSAGSNKLFSDFSIGMLVDSQDQAEQSAFYEDSVCSTFKDNLYSLASRTIKRKSKDGEIAETTERARKELNSYTKRLNRTGVLDGEMGIENPKECLDYETDFSYSEYDQLLDLGVSYADLILFEASQNQDNDTSLYFSDASSPISLLSSGGWNDGGTVKCERKPTIDQEFEQYFSSLML